MGSTNLPKSPSKPNDNPMIIGLPRDVLSLLAIMLTPAELCDTSACEAFRSLCASCRALHEFFAETRSSFIGTYVHVDSPLVCAGAHRAGLVFDPRALSQRVARDFAFFPRMYSLIASTDCVHTQRGTTLIDGLSVEMYTSLLLRCAALDVSTRWMRRITELRIDGSWLGTCSEIAAFSNLRSLALVECRCNTVAGLDELDLESLSIDALSFYTGRRGGRFIGPVTVGPEILAPILRVRKLSVRRTPVVATALRFCDAARRDAGVIRRLYAPRDQAAEFD